MGCVGLFVRGCGTLGEEKDECGRTERQPALS